MARLAAAVAFSLALQASGCADSHDPDDGGWTDDAHAEDAVMPQDAPIEGGATDSPDGPPARLDVRLVVTDLPGGAPVAGAPWTAMGSAGAASSGTTDAGGIALLGLDAVLAPFDIEVTLGTETYYIRDIRTSVSIAVHADPPLPTPSADEVTVEIAGARTGEVVTVAGSNAYPGMRVLGPPPRVGFRWRDPARPADAVAFAFTPRTYMEEDLEIPLPDGSGTPRTIAVVARGAAPGELASLVSEDLTTGPTPTRVPMRIEIVGEGTWVPHGPIDRVLGAMPLDPQFTETAGGFEGSIAVFDDEAARPGDFHIGPHDAQWTARVPGPIDFELPRAAGAPLVSGGDVSSATVAAEPSTWSQILVRIQQARPDGTTARVRWIAPLSGAPISVLPARSTLEELGFERGGADVVVRADTIHLIAPAADLDVGPVHYVESSDLSTVVRLPPS